MPIVPAAITYLEKRNPSVNESKFWAMRFIPSIQRKGGTALRLWWGRIGTSGQTKDFDVCYATDNECLMDAKARAEDKLRSGYVARTSCDWMPEFLKAEGRAPSIYRDGDGWEVENGRPVRPLGRSERAELERARAREREAWERERTNDAWDRRARELEKARDRRRSPLAVENGIFEPPTPRNQPKPAPVSLKGERVIDFEE